jgi:hypothetical protein
LEERTPVSEGLGPFVTVALLASASDAAQSALAAPPYLARIQGDVNVPPVAITAASHLPAARESGASKSMTSPPPQTPAAPAPAETLSQPFAFAPALEPVGLGISLLSFDDSLANHQGQAGDKPALHALDMGAGPASSFAGTPALGPQGAPAVPATPGDGRGTGTSTTPSDAAANLAGILNTQSGALGHGTQPGKPGPAPKDIQDGWITLWIDNNKYIPVNADDDNGSPMTDGIPVRRDFSVQPLEDAQTGNPVDDKDLVKAVVSFGPDGLPGHGPSNILSVSVSYAGSGRVELWNDASKDEAYTTGTRPAGNDTFYIEGTVPSSSLNDVTIEATWTWVDNTGNHEIGTDAQVTVTPIVNSLAVTPKNPAQTTFVTDPTGAQIGVNSGQQAGNGQLGDSQAPGATFGANVTRSGAPGNAIFIQNVSSYTNNLNGNTHAVVYTAASGFPALDLVTRWMGQNVPVPILDKASLSRSKLRQPA